MTAAKITLGLWEVNGLTVSCYGRGTVAICPVPQNGGTFECCANADAIAAVPKMIEALGFYAKNWRANGDGDSGTPGLSRTWMEPTDDLHNDEGGRATEALKAAGVLS